MLRTIPGDIIGQLREALAGIKNSDTYKDIVEPKERVLARFQPTFSKENVSTITPEEYQSFLLFDNNRHWSGLHRQGTRMCADMGKLREALAWLVDESSPVEERLNRATSMVSGMGKNVATAILLVVFPERYGVWNNRSEAHLKHLGIWPGFERGESFGSRYIKVNQVLLQLRDALQTDLWTLDALWWHMDQQAEGALPPEVANDLPVSSGICSAPSFGLERHLHEFLRDNWEHIELGRDWMIYQEPGDDEAGYEYPCDVGRIDILAKHRNQARFLVIELKRNQTSDQTVGQLMRYMGWVKKHLAINGEEVCGMIICREADKALKYALTITNNIQLRLYQVEFHLMTPDNKNNTM
ncbi:hypothetical protein JCM31598_43330 [Desulfonatronum parangueonense]